MSFIGYWCTVLCAICIAENRLLQIADLNLLTSSDYESIFGNINYLDKLKKNAEYNIDVNDKYGKYIKLSYKSKHPDNVEILKLDEIAHKSKIMSLVCSNNGGDDDAIKLRFKSEKIAGIYHKMVESAMDLKKKYFITGGHDWNCTKRDRVESISHQIIDTDINEKELTLYTVYAKLNDIFQDLDISFKTNMNYHPTNPVPRRPRPKQTKQTRRRLGFFGALWEGFSNGVNAAVDYVEDVVEEVAEVAVTVTRYLSGEPVTFSDYSYKTWSWNYDNITSQSLNPYYFEDGVECTDCYIFMDVVYIYEITIANYVINRLYLYVGGSIEINIDIASNKPYYNEWRQRTKSYPIPDFAFSAAGYEFGLYVYGSVAIGAIIDIDAFALTVKVAGWMEKGILYDGTTGEQYYINNQSLVYGKEGPRAQFESAKVTVYARPTLNLELKHVGSLYFGIQPEFILDITKNDHDSDCPLYFVPSVKLTHFIGVNLTIVDWHKQIAITPQQSTLNNLAGCINRFDITRSQTVQSDATTSDYIYTGPTSNAFCGNTLYGSTSYGGDVNYYVFTDYWDNWDVISVTFSLCASSYDTELTILDAWNNTIATNDDSDSCGTSSTRSEMTFTWANFTTYVSYIGVGGYGDAFGDYTLQITCTSRPTANAFCGDTIYGSTSSALDINYYVFYYVDSVTFSLCGSTYDTKLYILDESNNTIAWDDDSCGTTRSEITLSSTDFTTYVNYIGIGGYGDAFGDYTLQITCTGGSRRRLQTSSLSTQTASAYIDYSEINNLYDNSVDIFGNASTEWWGNLSSVNDICNDWSLICHGYAVPIILPQKASLLISVQDDDSLIGIYHTLIEITPQNGWDLANASVYSEVSCVARHSLEEVYDNPDDDLKRYHVYLLDWYCDTNLIDFGIDNTSNPDDYAAWECMISLSWDMSAISLDKSFGTILLFDSSDWCHVFTLTTKPGYTLNFTKINNINWNTFQYPSALWYGLWNCGPDNSTSYESQLYFDSFNHTTTITTAYFYLDIDTYYLLGYTDLDKMEMTLWIAYYLNDTGYWEYIYDEIKAVGNLDILYDGTIIYGGTIEFTTCTGFLFQGYINMTQFDYMDINNDNDISTTNTPTNSDTSISSTNYNTPSIADTDTPSSVTVTTSFSDSPSIATTDDIVVLPTNSPSITPTDYYDKNNSNSNVYLGKEGIIMFVIGIVSNLLVLGSIFIFCRCRSKQVSTENHYQLMNEQL